jgi:hypothetical protein
MSKIICPICGAKNAVQEVPWSKDGYASQDICPCCGTHYGEDDWANTEEERRFLFIELRKQWIAGGMLWKHDHPEDPFPQNHPPQNWNPQEQLKNIPKEFLGEDENY